MSEHLDRYEPKKIEKKWQNKWENDELFYAKDDLSSPKHYLLIEFPYPSGDGLHVGHPRPYIGLDIIAHKRRSEGKNVLYPIGWDAFGLPTENYAIKTGIHPKVVTKQNTDRFRKQIKSLGISFDWSREINTTDPEYYKWTQWIFLKLLEHGLAYKKKMPINWCLSCKIGLANEEVVGGMCERCGGNTDKREKEQWMLAITKYAEKLLNNLDDLDYLERIKTQQRNWIGRSAGALVTFSTSASVAIDVFTTRIDTIFGATYLVVSPKHPVILLILDKLKNKKEVSLYIKKDQSQNNFERNYETREITGVELKGVYAINPANGKQIPIWVSDYVLMEYGTGAIMAVPAHDERDFVFAERFSLSQVKVVVPFALGHMSRNAEDIAAGAQDAIRVKSNCFSGDGELINSGQFNGLSSSDARKAIIKHLGAKEDIHYKLRDWVFSRQRYWGEPIPVIFCDSCGVVPVPENELPVLLPDISDFKPTDSGESPLANISDWVDVKCPNCRGAGRRETDVMPNWAGSSWYYLRYADPRCHTTIASTDKLSYWMPVDWYNGGMEHTTLHLLYSRFWNLFLYDIGLAPTAEPYKKRTSHGLILAEGGEKMSKSKGNVVNPDSVVEMYGADTVRVYEMFMGPFDQDISWSSVNILGSRRFLEKVWDYVISCKKRGFEKTSINTKQLIQKTIKKVSGDIENMRFNTAVSHMMICINKLHQLDIEENLMCTQDDIEDFLKLLSPFAPHITEELWSYLGQTESIHKAKWPKINDKYLRENTVKIAIQIGGKVRTDIIIPKDAAEDIVKNIAMTNPVVLRWTEGKSVERFIYIKNKIMNILVS